MTYVPPIVKYIDRIMSGEYELLGKTFFWEATPQGHEYWSARYHGEVPLSDEDRAFLWQLYAENIRDRLLK